MSATLAELDALIAQDEAQPEATPQQPVEAVEQPASLAELDQLIEQDDLPEGDRLDAIVEPAIAIAGAAPVAVGAGVAGLAQGVFGETGEAEQTVRGIQESIQPETQAGQESLSNIMEIAGEFSDTLTAASKPFRSLLVGAFTEATGGDLGDAITAMADVDARGFNQVAADKVLEITNSPLAATAVAMSPDIALSFVPAKNLGAKGKAQQKQIAKRIQAGDPDKSLAPVRLSNKEIGKVIPDKEAIEVMKQGFQDKFVQAMKNGSREDKINIRKMLDKFEEMDRQELVKGRPIDVAGKGLSERLKAIQKANKSSGAEINKIAKDLKGQSVDVSKPINDFGTKLDEFGVRIVKNEKGDFVPDYTDSILAPGDRAPLNEVVRQMNRISKQGLDAQQTHILKGIIDDNVTFGKSDTGISGRLESALKDFRRGLDTELDNKFPQYNKANTTYAETIAELDNVKKLIGTKRDLFGQRTDELLGQLTRRLDSNAVSRVDLENAIDSLDAVATKYGGTFNDNIRLLARANNRFQEAFGTVAETSLKGDIGAVMQQQATQGTTAAATEAGRLAMRRLKGANREKAVKALHDLLARP